MPEENLPPFLSINGVKYYQTGTVRDLKLLSVVRRFVQVRDSRMQPGPTKTFAEIEAWINDLDSIYQELKLLAGPSD